MTFHTHRAGGVTLAKLLCECEQMGYDAMRCDGVGVGWGLENGVKFALCLEDEVEELHDGEVDVALWLYVWFRRWLTLGIRLPLGGIGWGG